MKYKIIKLSVLLVSIGMTAQAQQATTTSGGDASGSGGTVAYSVGQIVYTTYTDASGKVSQGVQQPYEIFTVGINEPILNISLSVFPNPTADNLTLLISEYNNEKLSYQFFDMQGRMLFQDRIVGTQTQINATELPSATYFINIVNQESNTIQSFKIIKL
ncbi:MAG: T9SS type A sorting domain-containing protein [Salibacteraceae bacterium]